MIRRRQREMNYGLRFKGDDAGDGFALFITITDAARLVKSLVVLEASLGIGNRYEIVDLRTRDAKEVDTELLHRLQT